jgi:glycosyltransferase involved in cell wall biosynthesis
MIKVVSCFWNVENYIEKCINSVKSQTYRDFKMYLIDDMSNDNTNQIIEKLIEGDERFVHIKNTEKKFKLKNLDDLLMDESLIDDEDIIVELDGDDWFYNELVLQKVFDRYSKNKNLWITNGSFIYSDGRMGFSSKANPNTIRRDLFVFSHLRTWKAHLWRSIDEEMFLDENKNYFKSGADVAYSFPMVEMSGENHYEFIPDILLVYNEENPYNDHKQGSASGSNLEQIKVSNMVRNKQKLNKLVK